MLTPIKANNGYAHIQLFRGGQGKIHLVHRIVATVFIPNPDRKPQVNHIDEDKMNNNVSNLEWVTAKENMNHGTRLSRHLKNANFRSEKRLSAARRNGDLSSKPISQIDGTNIIATYPSAKAAARATKLSHSHICECANHQKCKHVGGFAWVWVEEARRNDLLGSQF